MSASRPTASAKDSPVNSTRKLEPRVLAGSVRKAALVAIGALLITTSQIAPASAAPVGLPLLVNFQSAGAPVPTGYVADTGEAFTSTRGYGWTTTAGTPLSLAGNGRDRNVNSDQRLDTFMQMQLKPGSPGVTTEGAWRAEIANGSYQVTVAAGDAGYFDSRHVVRVEGNTAIDFTPTGVNPFVTQTVTTSVTDGILNIDAQGGTNTKINYLEIRPVAANSPTVTSVDPVAGATNVSRSKAVTVQLSAAVDSTSLDGLTLVGPNGQSVAGNRNTDAAGSNATFVPAQQLGANTTYTVRTTAALKTATGTSYTPFSSTFTTGAFGDAVAPVNFNRTVFNGQSGVTALVLSPDRMSLFAAINDGSIVRYNLDSNGNPTGSPAVNNAFLFQRTILGMRFDPNSTPANPKLWISHGELCGEGCADFTGMISVLTGANLENRRDVIVGLPRSVKDHMNNGIEFGPDGLLYITQGSNSGYGAPDDVWGFRSEHPLNATILTANVNGDSRFNGTVNVNTSSPNNYNAFAANAPVKVYTEGVRNPFSLTWHSNGKLYAPVNESASGNAPAGPANNPPAINNLVSYNDYFTQIEPNRYYGHPNPSRGYFRLNGGNPTNGVDPFEVTEYPVGVTPDAKWRQPDLDLGVHRSANGSVEFRSAAFGANLQGQVLVTEYSQGDDVIAIKLDANGKPVSKAVVATGFFNPLAIASDPVTGRTYVGEYGRDPDGVGGQIALLSPNVNNPNPGEGTPVAKINFGTETMTVPTGYSQDFGQAYNAARGYGWETLAGTPLNLTGNGRERNVLLDKRLDSFMHYKFGAGTEGRFQLDVPNGTYKLNIGLGDPSYTDSVNVVRAEGNVVANFTPTAAELTRVVNATVTVADGKLTLDQTGGTNTKISYLDVLGSAGPVTPPPTDPPPATGGNTKKVDFQPASATAPAGYVADTGAAYNPTRGYGWETLAGTPVDLTRNARERNVLADKRLDTFMHMNFTVATGGNNGTPTEGRWQLDIANGTYDVTVGLGDASYFDSVHVVRAEGNVVGQFTPSAAEPNRIFTARVTVADGKLTLDQTGGANTKIGFVDVVPATGTPVEPPPTGGGQPVARVNFQNEGAPVPAGYTADFGTAYSPARGFGWETRDALSLSLVGNGRDRNVVADQRFDTHISMQLKPGSPGVVTEGQWSMNLPNGNYKVTVGVGDPSYFDSTHVIRAEANVLGSFSPTAATPNTTFVSNSVAVTDGKLTIDAVGGNNTKINYVDIDTAGGTTIPTDTTAPTVTVVPSGTTNAQGQFVGSATVTINATDASGVANTSYSLDGGVQQAYNAPLVVSTVGAHTVVATATDTKGNTSAPVTSTFNVVAAQTVPSSLQIQSPQAYLGLGDRMIFSTVNYTTQPTQNLTLRNGGTVPLQVTGITMGGTNPNAFKLVGVQPTGQPTNFSIAPSATATVGVQFTPTVHESNQSAMTITTNENGSSSRVVTLGGMNARNFEDVLEPSLQSILDTFGYQVNAAVSDEGTNFISKSNGPIGDEVITPYFSRSNNSQPVNLYPLANYSGRTQFAKGEFGFNNKNSSSAANAGYYMPGGTDAFGGQNQKLLPSINGSTSWSTPTAAFGYRQGNGGNVPNFSDDKLNQGAQLHNVRAYVAKDMNGVVIPNTYILGEDLGNIDCCFKNWDYQDHVFLLTNVKPETTAPTAGANPGTAGLNLNFSSAVAGSVTDSAGNGTGFTSVQANTAGNQYVASAISLNTSAGRLSINSAAGTSSLGTNNQRNALQCTFNGSTGNFRVQSRLVGPFNFLDVENEQQAIFFGPDQNNHLKAEVEYGGGVPTLTIWLEKNGSGAIVKRIPMPNVNAATLDLRIDVNTDAKTANVLYSINGGVFTQLSDAAFAVPAWWMSVDAKAGVLVSHANGTQFTGTYDSFAITRL